MRSSFSLLTVLAGMAGNANAHHGITGQFDTSTTFEISGVVTKLDFVNPHSYINFEVTADDGSVVPWRCEMRAASVLKRSGWSEDMFTPGTNIHIVGSPDRRDVQTCYMVRVLFDNGMKLERYGQIEPGDAVLAEPDERPHYLANGQPNISGDWAVSQRLLGGTDVLGTGRIAHARDATGIGIGAELSAGIEPTAAGLAAAAGYVAATDNPRFHCMPVNIFNDWTFDQHVNRITQDDDLVTLQYGFMDLVRIVYIGMTEHPANIVPSKAGHSIGQWDGDVLVVDTVGFEPGYLSTQTGAMYSEQMRVIERFSYDSENMELHRSYVAEDPRYFTGQFTGQDVIEIADIPFESYDCSDLTYEHINPRD